MDLFKLGLRNILGITLPGAVLVLVVSYVLYVCAIALGQDLTGFKWVADAEFLILVGSFLISYVIGSVMRLNSADIVDKKSADLLYKENWEGKDTNSFCNARDAIKNCTDETFDKAMADVPDDFDDWIYIEDTFPYPVWHVRKLKEYHPDEVFTFFKRYRKCVLTGKYKVFFNYCKMTIYHKGQKEDNMLVLEVNRAEAVVRFYAGTYYALDISFWWLLLPALVIQVIAPFLTGSAQVLSISGMLLPGFLIQAIVPFLTGFGQVLSVSEIIDSYEGLSIIYLLVTGAFAFAVFKMKKTILRRFRTLRIKEVDTVYDAFYLVSSR